MYDELEQAIQAYQINELIKRNIPLAFTEPIVIQSKIKRQNTKDGIEILWQNTPLLLLTRHIEDSLEIWHIKDKDGITLKQITINKKQ